MTSSKNRKFFHSVYSHCIVVFVAYHTSEAVPVRPPGPERRPAGPLRRQPVGPVGDDTHRRQSALHSSIFYVVVFDIFTLATYPCSVYVKRYKYIIPSCTLTCGLFLPGLTLIFRLQRFHFRFFFAWYGGLVWSAKLEQVGTWRYD